MRDHSFGSITMQVGAEPTASDIMVANIFAKLGHDVDFIAANKGYMVRTPDIHMDRIDWEIKCIESDKIDKVRRNISTALGQSGNIIIGTFRTSILDEKIIRYVQRHVLPKKKGIKRLKIVTKTHEVIDIK